MNNRSGQIIQITIILIVLFIVGYSFVIGHYVVSEFNTNIAGDFSEPAKDFIAESAGAWTFADSFYPVALVILIIGVIVTFLYIPTHPALIVIEFIMLVFVVIIGGIIGNVNENLFNDTSINASSAVFPTIELVNNNLALFATIVGLISLAVLFMKREER